MVLKKTEARPCLTKAMFTPCRIVFLAETKSSQNFALGLFAFNEGRAPQFLLSYCQFLSSKRLSISFLALEPRKLTRWDVHKYARQAYDLGVRYIGGCCGFEPYHIRAISEEVGTE